MLQWYVMQTKPKKELIVYEQLCIRNIESYYPQIRIKTSKPYLRKLKPYFPGYLFVHFDIDKFGQSVKQWVPGSIGLVGYGGEPAFVPNSVLQAIRRHVDDTNNIKDEAFDGLETGEIVTITTGPFAGYRAIFDSYLPGNERAHVFLQMLQDRQVCVVLSEEQLERTKQR